MIIYYDEIQEGHWFSSLHPRLEGGPLRPITGAPAWLARVLAYDRPDIILTDNDEPILVVERTVEVPSGHNVGQRFARLAAAAECKVPVVYFGPYAAYKHGGATRGPRYMNLRLFYALDKMAEIEGTAVASINWPVDEHYEIIQADPSKDRRVRDYLELFFGLYDDGGLAHVNATFGASPFHREQMRERDEFVRTQVQRPEQYDSPPDSVVIAPTRAIAELRGVKGVDVLEHDETVLYKIGMTYVRSDPYTGMAMLYDYLYAGGLNRRTRNMVLHFPAIQLAQWSKAASGRRPRKDIKLYRHVADAILFKDGFVGALALRDELRT